MDRRLLVAIGLMLVVAVLPSILFPPEPPTTPPGTAADSTLATSPDSSAPAAAQRERDDGQVGAVTPAPSAARQPARPAADTAARPAAPERLVVVESDLYRYEFSTRGGRLVSAVLFEYSSLAPRDSTADGRHGAAQLIPENSEFLSYTYVTRQDSLALAEWELEPNQSVVSVGRRGASLEWRGRHGTQELRLTYHFVPDRYLYRVEGEISGVDAGVLRVGLGPRLRSIDGDTSADIRAYGLVTKEARRTERLKFSSLDPMEQRRLDGPFEWVAIKSKYFLQAVLAIEDGQAQFGGVVAVGGLRTGKRATSLSATTSLSSPNGQFAHEVYVGPQEFRRLQAIGHGLEDVNPYGWILRPIIRPFANFIVRILLWMHETLNLAYGWVLILFGILVRLVLWPLNQKAMRSGTEMQAIQPEIKALQDRFKGMKLYKERGVNPLGSCLPMLIPMPVLFALFFVFMNTIEFRGVSFLWLPDLSLADPLYIIPLLMGVSMYGVSKIGQRGVPPNPQAKMMTYIMPVMFTFLFLRFSSGLNLYYAVSNIASIPQQWMISNERIRRLGRQPAKRSKD